MEEAIFMHVGEAIGDLIDHVSAVGYGVLDLFLCEFLSFFFHLRVDLVDVVVEVFEDHVELLGDEEDLF